MKFDVIRLSSKGQLVIPVQVRKILGLKAGTKLALLTDGRDILLKILDAPDVPAYQQLAQEARRLAKRARTLPRA